MIGHRLIDLMKSLEDKRSVDRCGGATAIARHGKGYDKREDPGYGGSERKGG